jgi:hypothetical protein
MMSIEHVAITIEHAAIRCPLSTSFTSPPIQGDASKEVTTPERRRRPIRWIWVFTRETEKARDWGLNLDIASKEGAARSAVVAVTATAGQRFPPGQSPQP